MIRFTRIKTDMYVEGSVGLFKVVQAQNGLKLLVSEIDFW